MDCGSSAPRFARWLGCHSESRHFQIAFELLGLLSLDRRNGFVVSDDEDVHLAIGFNPNVCHGVHIDNEICSGQDEFAHSSSSYCVMRPLAPGGRTPRCFWRESLEFMRQAFVDLSRFLRQTVSLSERYIRQRGAGRGVSGSFGSGSERIGFEEDCLQ